MQNGEIRKVAQSNFFVFFLLLLHFVICSIQAINSSYIQLEYTVHTLRCDRLGHSPHRQLSIALVVLVITTEWQINFYD